MRTLLGLVYFLICYLKSYCFEHVDVVQVRPGFDERPVEKVTVVGHDNHRLDLYDMLEDCAV